MSNRAESLLGPLIIMILLNHFSHGGSLTDLPSDLANFAGTIVLVLVLIIRFTFLPVCAMLLASAIYLKVNRRNLPRIEKCYSTLIDSVLLGVVAFLMGLSLAQLYGFCSGMLAFFLGMENNNDMPIFGLAYVFWVLPMQLAVYTMQYTLVDQFAYRDPYRQRLVRALVMYASVRLLWTLYEYMFLSVQLELPAWYETTLLVFEIASFLGGATIGLPITWRTMLMLEGKAEKES